MADEQTALMREQLELLRDMKPALSSVTLLFIGFAGGFLLVGRLR
jgi:hypothetical protein